MAHWKALKRIALYLRATQHKCLRFAHSKTKLGLIGYVDVDYAESDIDRLWLCTGYIYYTAGGPIVWWLQLQPVVAQSSCEAEYIAANAAAHEAE